MGVIYTMTKAILRLILVLMITLGLRGLLESCAGHCIRENMILSCYFELKVPVPELDEVPFFCSNGDAA